MCYNRRMTIAEIDDGEEALEAERTRDEHAPASDDPTEAEYCTVCGAAWPCETITPLERAPESP